MFLQTRQGEPSRGTAYIPSVIIAKHTLSNSQHAVPHHLPRSAWRQVYIVVTRSLTRVNTKHEKIEKGYQRVGTYNREMHKKQKQQETKKISRPIVSSKQTTTCNCRGGSTKKSYKRKGGSRNGGLHTIRFRCLRSSTVNHVEVELSCIVVLRVRRRNWEVSVPRQVVKRKLVVIGQLWSQQWKWTW